MIEDGCPQVDALVGKKTSCLDCPLAQCLQEGGQKRGSNIRREQVWQLREEGLTLHEIATRLGVSKRSIFRHLAKLKHDSNSS